MRVKLTDRIESAHKWIDQDTGKTRHIVLKGRPGDELDSEQLQCGDPERALKRLVDLGHAEAV